MLSDHVAVRSAGAAQASTLFSQMGHAIASAMHRFSDYVDEYKRYQRTVSELTRLSDHELCDIGLRREQICEIARDCAAGSR